MATKGEVMEWLQNPTTKYVIDRLTISRNGFLEGFVSLPDNEKRIALADQVIGMDRAINILKNMEGEDE